MGLKNDAWIRRMAVERGMISPFAPNQVRAKSVETEAYRRASSEKPFHGPTHEDQKIISYGTSSYGYDLRVSDEFKIFTNINSTIVDPKNFDPGIFFDVKARNGYVILPPNSFALARSVEYFKIPRSVMTICLGKSTYARCGIIVNVTPFEPEWEGHVTLEFSNTTNSPARVYAGEGCAQVLFLEGDEVCEVSYKDRGGKYQNQVGITLPR